MTNLSEWAEQPVESISLETMDKLVQDLADLRAKHKAAKDVASEIYKELAEAEQLVINALKVSGKKKYENEHVGRVNIVVKETYATPKTNEDKQKLFDYIDRKYGADVLISLLGINHQTLNSWANKETEQDPLVQIPGLQAPTSEETLRFTSKKGGADE